MLIHLIILFIYVFALLTLNIPQIATDQYLKTKLYIFGGVFLFEFVVTLIVTIYKKCLVDVARIAKASLLAALVATVGYSIYTDIFTIEKPFAQNLSIAIVITASVAIGYLVDGLLTSASPGLNDCLNNIYQCRKA